MEGNDAVMPEEKLLKSLIVGQEKAYEELTSSLEKPLMNFIYQYIHDLHTAEDIFQETFIRVVRKISDFKPNSKLSTWIFTIARNLCLDYIKSKKRKRDVSLEEESENDQSKPVSLKNLFGSKYLTPGEVLEKTEQQIKVREALSRLSHVKREALILRTYLDLSYEEISKITDAPVGTCKYRVHQALMDIGEALSGPMQKSVEHGG